MYKDGWWLAMRMPRIPWGLEPEALQAVRARGLGPRRRPGRAVLPARRLHPGARPRAEHPEKVAGAAGAVLGGGRAYKVLPLLGGAVRLLRHAAAAPGRRPKFEYRGDVQNVASGMIPRIYNHSYTISADLVIPDGGAEGVIVAEADHLGGFSLFVAGRQAQAHLLDDGRVHLPPAGRRSRCRPAR